MESDDRMKNTDRKDILDALADKGEWLKELDRETDRGAAVLMMAFIDHLLELSLADVLVPGSSVHLSGFASKVHWARALGIISAAIEQDLFALSEIRNKFAHQLHGLTFDTPAIAAVTNKFHVTGRIKTEADTHRKKFEFTAVFVARYLVLRRKHLVAAKEPKGWRVSPEE